MASLGGVAIHNMEEGKMADQLYTVIAQVEPELGEGEEGWECILSIDFDGHPYSGCIGIREDLARRLAHVLRKFYTDTEWKAVPANDVGIHERTRLATLRLEVQVMSDGL